MSTPLKIVEKPWGKEEILATTKIYCFKKITILKGCKTSLQFHKFKEETNYIAEGKALITYNGNQFSVEAGHILHCRPLDVHRIEAVDGDVVVYEASTAAKGFETDVFRLEDSFGREGTNKP